MAMANPSMYGDILLNTPEINALIKGGIQRINVIYETMNYGAFRKFEGNRIVTDARVSKLKASFGVKAIDTPVIVNEHMQIVDGQGRYEARKALNLPIPFCIIPELDFDDCVRLNRYNTNWSLSDYVESWSMNAAPEIRGNYLRLIECAKRNNITYAKAIALTRDSNSVNCDIKGGSYKFTTDDSELVSRIIAHGNEIVKALCYDKRTNDTFWRAVKVLLTTRGYDGMKMLKNCGTQRSSYNQMAALESQLSEFSRIYNYKSRGDKIYFEDYMRNKGRNVRSYDNLTGIAIVDRTDVSTLTKY